MVFSSLIFLYVFLPAVLLFYYVMPRKGRNAVLLLFSIVFYAWGEPVYVLGIIASVVINYFYGLALERHHSKLLLTSNIILNLGYLAFFKYTGFVIGTINRIFGTDMSVLKIALPIGISFYTFQALSYTIDVYRGKVNAGKNILDFGAYITMFPQLIAGPIVRYQTVAGELRTRRECLEDFSDGIIRFASGLGKKVLLANSVGQIWDAVREGSESDLTTSTIWLGMICFTLQIYFDFSGYSDMAIGLGRMFGFHFDENFNYPYVSGSVTEFWRRWHISLSTWFKEYVYIPLGGNRSGVARQLRNIFIVWMLTGLWHGAAWSFVLWGVYYGILLIVEKVLLKKILEKLPRIITWLYTIIIVVIGWGIFGLADVLPELKSEFIKGVFFVGNNGVFDSHTLYLLNGNIVLIITAAVISTGVFTKLAKKYVKKHTAVYSIGSMVYVAVMMLASTACIVADTYNPFLYFRF
ncbi:MAG: MBOAT family protein [Eubacterium sp.]|nr:MBOAT family protein [Eubacterium sp.]